VDRRTELSWDLPVGCSLEEEKKDEMMEMEKALEKEKEKEKEKAHIKKPEKGFDSEMRWHEENEISDHLCVCEIIGNVLKDDHQRLSHSGITADGRMEQGRRTRSR